ncbi:MAG TPA: GIY-YIG nuclease family protein [Gemmatimonadales bacterium]|jgi:DNA-binding XRE family transcriptional regulator
MTYLYVIAASQATKIGVSVKPERRLQALQIQSAEPLRLVDSFDLRSRKLARKIEAHCHSELHQFRIAGSEWFSCSTEECLEVARSLCQAAANDECHTTAYEAAELRSVPSLDAALIAALVGSRKLAGLEQAGLAARCDWAPQTVSQIESGLRAIHVIELPMLCRALGIDEMRFYQRWLAFRAN